VIAASEAGAKRLPAQHDVSVQSLTRLRAERQRMEGSQRPVVANSRSLSGAGMRVPVLLATTHKCGESTRGPIFLASDRLLA